MLYNIQAIRVTESNEFICGNPDYPIEGVTMDNIRISYLGGGKKKDSDREIPEISDAYPKAKMFGILPAYGFYIRHARNVKIYNFDISYETTDFRTVIFCEDVADLEIQGLRAESTADSAPFFRLKNTKNVQIQNCQPSSEINIFLKVEGKESKNILLSDTYKIKASRMIESTSEVSEDQIKIISEK